MYLAKKVKAFMSYLYHKIQSCLKFMYVFFVQKIVSLLLINNF